MKKFPFSKLLVLLLLPLPLWAQKTMNEARPDIRLLVAEKTAKAWADAEVDTAWVRAIRQCGLLAGVTVQKWDSVTTAANTYKYSLHSSFWRIRSLWRGQNQNRRPIMIVDDPATLLSEGASVPSEYGFIHQGTSGFELHLYPVPTGAEKVYYYYYGLPSIPTTATTATDLPTPLLPALLFEAASFLTYMEKQYEWASLFHGRALELITAYRQLTSNQGNTEVPQK